MRLRDTLIVSGGVAFLYTGAAAGVFALAEHFGITHVIPLFTETPVPEVLGPNIVPAALLLTGFGVLFGTALAFPDSMRWLNDNFS